MNLFQRRLLDQMARADQFRPGCTALYHRFHEVRQRYEAGVLPHARLPEFVRELQAYCESQLQAFREYRRDQRRSDQRQLLSKMIGGLNLWSDMLQDLLQASPEEALEIFEESLEESERYEDEIREGATGLKAA